MDYVYEVSRILTNRALATAGLPEDVPEEQHALSLEIVFGAAMVAIGARKAYLADTGLLGYDCPEILAELAATLGISARVHIPSSCTLFTVPGWATGPLQTRGALGEALEMTEPKDTLAELHTQGSMRAELTGAFPHGESFKSFSIFYEIVTSRSPAIIARAIRTVEVLKRWGAVDFKLTIGKEIINILL